MEYAQLKRAPFGRYTIIRRVVDGKCEWCGNTNAHGRCFQYGVEHDSGRIDFSSHKFCGIGCHEAFTDC